MIHCRIMRRRIHHNHLSRANGWPVAIACYEMLWFQEVCIACRTPRARARGRNKSAKKRNSLSRVNINLTDMHGGRVKLGDP